MFTNNKQKGFGLIGWVIIVVAIVIALSYFGINLRGIVESESGQSNFGYVKALITSFWNTYLAENVSYFWNEAVKPLWAAIWDKLNP